MMTVTDPRVLADMMQLRKTSGAELGRLAGTSRQFIHQLTKGTRASCSTEVATKIEKALRVQRGVVFRDRAAELRPPRNAAA